MKLAALFSGGKDSTYAIYQAIQQGHEIKYLITMFPKREDSYMFHHPLVELTKFQAEAMEIKHITQETAGEKENELEDLKKVLNKIKNEIDGVVSGALASNYQKIRVDRICEELGLKSIAPLWQADQLQRLRDEFKIGFKIMITAVAAEGLDKNWLGKIVDEKVIRDLENLHKKYGIHPGFEGGEAESFVLDCPIFKKKIVIKNFDVVWDKKTSSGYIQVKNFDVVDK